MLHTEGSQLGTERATVINSTRVNYSTYLGTHVRSLGFSSISDHPNFQSKLFTPSNIANLELSKCLYKHSDFPEIQSKVFVAQSVRALVSYLYDSVVHHWDVQ